MNHSIQCSDGINKHLSGHSINGSSNRIMNIFSPYSAVTSLKAPLIKRPVWGNPLYTAGLKIGYIGMVWGK